MNAVGIKQIETFQQVDDGGGAFEKDQYFTPDENQAQRKEKKDDNPYNFQIFHGELWPGRCEYLKNITRTVTAASIIGFMNTQYG